MSQVLSQSPANRDDCKGEAVELGNSDLCRDDSHTRWRSWGSDHRPSSWLTTCSAHLSVHTERKGLGVCSDALVTAAGFHTLCDLMLERSGSDLTSSLWKHVSCVC